MRPEEAENPRQEVVPAVSLNPSSFVEHHAVNPVADAAWKLRQLMGEGSTIFGRRVKCSACAILQFERGKQGIGPAILRRMEDLAREKFPNHEQMIKVLGDGATGAWSQAGAKRWPLRVGGSPVGNSPTSPKHYGAGDATREMRALLLEGGTRFGRRVGCAACSILQFEKDKVGLRPVVLERLEALAREKFPDRKKMIEALADGAAIARGRAMGGGWWHDPGEHSERINRYEDPLPQPTPHYTTEMQATSLRDQAGVNTDSGRLFTTSIYASPLIDMQVWRGRLKEIKRLCWSYTKAGTILEQMAESPLRKSARMLGEAGRYAFPLDEVDGFVADFENPDVSLGVEIKPAPRSQRIERPKSTDMQLGSQSAIGLDLFSPGEACKLLRGLCDEGMTRFSRRVLIKPVSLYRFEAGKQSLRPVALERLLALAREKFPSNSQIIAPLSWATTKAWQRVEMGHGGPVGDRKPKVAEPYPWHMKPHQGSHFLTRLQLEDYQSNLHMALSVFPWRARLVGLRRVCESYCCAANILDQLRYGPIAEVSDPEITEPYSIPWDEVTAFVKDYKSKDPELGLAVGVVVNAETGEPVPPRRKRDTSEY